MNNLDKHAAVLEGVSEISRHILLSRIALKHFFLVHYEASAELEQSFVHLYKNILTFLARVRRFLNRRGPG